MTAPDCITLLVTAAAAVSDLTRGKVYNWLTYPAVLVGLAWSLTLRTITFPQSLAGLAAALLIYGLMHKYGGLGAGDVKLMAAVGAFKGFSFILFSSFYILCIGSVLGLFVLAARGKLFPSIKWVFQTISSTAIPGIPRPPEERRTAMPFAPAIFVAVAYCIYLETTRGEFVINLWA